MMNMLYVHLGIDIMKYLKLPTQAIRNGRYSLETEGTIAFLSNLLTASETSSRTHQLTHSPATLSQLIMNLKVVVLPALRQQVEDCSYFSLVVHDWPSLKKSLGINLHADEKKYTPKRNIKHLVIGIFCMYTCSANWLPNLDWNTENGLEAYILDAFAALCATYVVHCVSTYSEIATSTSTTTSSGLPYRLTKLLIDSDDLSNPVWGEFPGVVDFKMYKQTRMKIGTNRIIVFPTTALFECNGIF